MINKLRRLKHFGYQFDIHVMEIVKSDEHKEYGEN
jgi:hypothetical protein